MPSKLPMSMPIKNPPVIKPLGKQGGNNGNEHAQGRKQVAPAGGDRRTEHLQADDEQGRAKPHTRN